MKLRKILIFIFLTSCLCINWEQKLNNDLYENYSKFVFPSETTISHKIQIEFGSLIQVDTLKSQATIRIIIREWWYDPRLTWNPTNYGNLNSTVFPSDPQLQGLWITDLMIYEVAEKPMMNMGQMRIGVSNNGEVYWCRLGLVTLNMDMNLHKYPFDSQFIQITMESWRFPAEELRISFHSEPLILSDKTFTSNVGWKIIGLYTSNRTLNYTSGNYTTLYFYIKVQRAAATLVNTLIIPAFGIGFLGLFYYLLPRGNSERVQFVATLLLTEVTLLVVVTQYLPASKSDPILEGFLLVLTLMLKFVLAIAIVIDFLERKFRKKKKENPLVKFNEENAPILERWDTNNNKNKYGELGESSSSRNLELKKIVLGDKDNIDDVEKNEKKEENKEFKGLNNELFDGMDFDNLNELVFNNNESKENEKKEESKEENIKKKKKDIKKQEKKKEEENAEKTEKKISIEEKLDEEKKNDINQKSEKDKINEKKDSKENKEGNKDNNDNNVKNKNTQNISKKKNKKKKNKDDHKGMVHRLDLCLFLIILIAYSGFVVYFLIKWNRDDFTLKLI